MIDELNKDSLFCALMQYLAVRFKALNSATDKAAICNKTPLLPVNYPQTTKQSYKVYK